MPEDRPRLGAALERLPHRPGVYRFRDRAGRTLYVGKAKSLRARVRSYFRPGAVPSPHIARMVADVADLDVIVVDTEIEALILEANLIRRERPPYNVVLRDDKSFPYVKLSLRDPYPRASLVRRARLDGSRYTGPFLPASAARRALKVVQRQFRVATCNETFDGKRRPCLYYHLDQCLAPCAGKTSPQEYGAAVADALLFLEGRHKELERALRARMQQASAAREYEQAARCRDTLRMVERLAVRQPILSVGLEERDSWALHREGERAVLQLFQMRGGRVQARRELSAERITVGDDEFLAAALVQYYVDAPPPPEIDLPLLPANAELLATWLAERRPGRVRLRVPRRGARRGLLVLARSNAELAFAARFPRPAGDRAAALAGLAEALALPGPPERIECFDISNLHGTDSVASLVVWEGGEARRSEYRTFGIRGVSGPDDTASVHEAVGRRYRRRLAEGLRTPDLVVIDGGRGQLQAALAALAALGLAAVSVVALAKREELLFLAGREEPLRLERTSPALKLVQRIRDEAHRFAVSRHRRRRSRRTLRTELTELPGLGPVRARRLLSEFGSLDAVRRATPQELARVVGQRVAAALLARYGAEGS